MNEQKKLKVSDFKIYCNSMIKDIEDTGCTYVITKRGVAVAEVVPYKNRLFGYMKDAASIKGDTVEPVNVKWNADS
jgi:antitoxin (DNA-binding transcriptional repressor) of toxin-antitoxin stability system